MPELTTFTGSHNTYLDIGKRGLDRLSLSMQYMIHPSIGLGGLMTRFVLRSIEPSGTPQPLKIMQPRGEGEFSAPDGGKLKALRLAKFVIPVLNPGPPPLEFVEQARKLMVWEEIAHWTNQRLLEEGFEPLFEDSGLRRHIIDLVGGKLSPGQNFKLIMQLPSLEELYTSNKEGGE
jgi:hypothetical protein